MATISDIEVKRELRPCLIVNGDTENKALFHMWEQNSQIIPSPMVGGHAGGVISTVMGIVELEDGSVIRVAPYQVQFTDNKIQEYIFKPAGSSPVGTTELFGHIDGHPIYVIRDEYGRIVISDELFKELIERCEQ